MPKITILIFLSFLITSCGNLNKDESVSTYQLNPQLQSCVDSLKTFERFIDHGFICNSDFDECMTLIKDSTSKEDLMFIYNNPNISKAFKLFIFKLLYQKHPDVSAEILNDAVDDTTTIQHNSSCLGIVYDETYETSCFLYAHYINPDSMKSVIIQEHQDVSFFPNVLASIKPEKSNYESIRKLINDYPEALIALSKYRYSKDSILIQNKLKEFTRNADTSALIECLSVMDYTPYGNFNNESPYQSYYDSIILKFDLCESKKYRTAIPQIIYCYLRNTDLPYPSFNEILNKLYSIYSDPNSTEKDKHDIMYILQSINRCFMEVLNLKHYKMHEQEVINLENFLEVRKKNWVNYSFGYNYDKSLWR